MPKAHNDVCFCCHRMATKMKELVEQYKAREEVSYTTGTFVLASLNRLPPSLPLPTSALRQASAAQAAGGAAV